MSRDAMAPDGNGGQRRILSGRNHSPRPLSALLAEIPIPPLTQETQEAQETKERQETQERHERHEKQEKQETSPGEDASCVSCVKRAGVGETDLQRFLTRAAERSTSEVVKHRNAPDSEYRSPSWMFARCLKARSELSGLDSEAATALVDAELEAMFPNSPAPWVELGLPDFDSRGEVCDPRSDFLTAWGTIEIPFQLGSLVHEAALCAEEKPLDFGGSFGAADAKLEHLLSLCYWLADRAKGDFFLSCRDAGDALGVSAVTANQLMRRAQALGFLRSVGAYSEKDRARRRAKTWRFENAGAPS